MSLTVQSNPFMIQFCFSAPLPTYSPRTLQPRLGPVGVTDIVTNYSSLFFAALVRCCQGAGPECPGWLGRLFLIVSLSSPFLMLPCLNTTVYDEVFNSFKSSEFSNPASRTSS